MAADDDWDPDVFEASQGSQQDGGSHAGSPTRAKKVKKTNLKVKLSPKKKGGKRDKIDRFCFICETKKKVTADVVHFIIRSPRPSGCRPRPKEKCPLSSR